jgi:hypothetical protein
MRQQFFECEPDPAGVMTILDTCDIGIGRRPVQVGQGIGERRHSEVA